MKHSYHRLAIVGFVSIIATYAFARAHGREFDGSPVSTGSPVVVELFTSEGCSSCPPADALLARLAAQTPAANVQVIALEEHVDYWNDLGWSDPFSSSEWTERQYAYAGALGNGNPYTPQMVVDGSAEFVGSRTQQAVKSIAEAAAHPKTAVTLSQGTSNKPGTENFSVQVGKLAANAKGGAEVWLAITETGLHSAVTAGENAGHDVHHAAIVRSLRKIGEAKEGGELAFSGETSIPLRAGWKRENLRAVAFVQEKKSRRIVGAAETPLRRQ
ncbi:MAG TPA: DUF1223 domain-containing protein [Candidatus Acidoferrum sp.]|jgi:hypothetical protein|nr:DUF1223 domain-containing protein [Candidatus Acidoferrum sp.]